ncbi:unnamed protein product [Heterobilharzia americana]|nr:unnamed protein product [Heterobilharzia americana]
MPRRRRSSLTNATATNNNNDNSNSNTNNGRITNPSSNRHQYQSHHSINNNNNSNLRYRGGRSVDTVPSNQNRLQDTQETQDCHVSSTTTNLMQEIQSFPIVTTLQLQQNDPELEADKKLIMSHPLYPLLACYYNSVNWLQPGQILHLRWIPSTLN